MNPRASPSGPFQSIGRFSISAPQAFADGVDEDIVFNRVDFLQGEGLSIEDPLTGHIEIGPGLYFAQCQVSISAGMALELNIEIADGTVESDGFNATALGSVISTTCNGLLFTTDTPLTPAVFGHIRVSFQGTGAAGNIEIAELVVYKLAELGIE
jgi:hypothetical protein